MFIVKRARQGLDAIQVKFNGAQGVAVGGLLALGSGSAMAEVSAEAAAMTAQVTEDAEHFKTWALGLFTTLFLVALLIKMSKKWGNRGTSA